MLDRRLAKPRYACKRLTISPSSLLEAKEDNFTYKYNYFIHNYINSLKNIGNALSHTNTP